MLLVWPILLNALLPIAYTPQQSSEENSFNSYSREELIACSAQLSLCHAKNAEAVESELIARLPQLTTSKLVQCFADWRICGVGEEWEIIDVLASRKKTDLLVREFGLNKDWKIRGGIERLAYTQHSPVATQYMRTVFTRKLDDGENLYWPAMYLAKQCSIDALKYLDPGVDSKSIADGFSVSSLQFSSTVELFGICHYRPAIPYLVTIGMHAASLNMVDASDQSLRHFYPNSPHFDSLAKQQLYFCQRASRDGFQLHCKDD